MRLKFTIIAIIAVCFTKLYSQKTFAKGYYIDAKDSRVECLIRDEDWELNPTDFTVKTEENSTSKVVSFSEFKEFGVNEFKFVKTKVKLDKSSDQYNALTAEKALNLEEDTLVLRVLIEGEANLYTYKNDNFTRFFYNLNGSPITQLTFKMFAQEGGFGKNNTYKQELLNSLKCDKITQDDINHLEYEKDRLSDLFKEYNLCKASGMTDFRAKKVINTFELYAKAGVGISSLKYDDGSFSADFGSKAKFRPAIEVEINLSNKRKNYSLLVEASYQRYTSKGNTGLGNPDIEADYKTVDIAGGLRKYIHLNPKTLLFINGYMAFGFAESSKIENYDIRANVSPSLGIGCLYNKRYTLDIKYEFGRNILTRYVDLTAKYNTLAVSLGYKLL